MAVPQEFLSASVKANSEKSMQIPYRNVFANGEPYRSMLASNPWLQPPDYSKPLECPLYDRRENANGGGWEGKSHYWDTTVGRKHTYWKNFDLPRPTKDIHRLRRDMMEWGYCIVEDALSAEQCKYIRNRLEEQAYAEREVGTADITPFFHIMWTLVNKGDCFAKLIEFSPEWVQAGPLLEQLNYELLGGNNYALSFASNIAKPHCMPQNLHQDGGAIHPLQSPHFPTLVNNVYIMQDVNEVNGGTLVIPGSHKVVAGAGTTGPVGKLPPAINIEAPAGSVVMMDGRLLHGTGVNHTENWRYIMTNSNVKTWLRQQENWQLSVSPEVLKRASPKLLKRMGFATSGLLEVGKYTSMETTVDVRLQLDEGKYKRIGELKGPVTQEQRESLSIWQMKEKMRKKAAASKL
mmetsp:Transcript_2653/g.6222  ORF Transcript_2653/g.6222 Transcript_2653/m.6222 type:complete len:406 (-) Transcript_2653:50-1267(-)